MKCRAIIILLITLIIGEKNAYAQCPKVPQTINSYYNYWGLQSRYYNQIPRIAPGPCKDTAMMWYNPSDSNVYITTPTDSLPLRENLQQTLNIGREKNTPYADSAVAGDTSGYYRWFGYPSNYGVNYAPFGVMGRFSAGWQRFNDVNLPLARPNVVAQVFNYNATPGGAIENSAEQAGASFRYETFFNLNAAGRGTTEIHWPEFYYNHGAGTERLWSYYIDNLTGATVHQSQVQSFNFDTKNTDKPYYGWSAATTNNDSSVTVAQTINLGVGSVFSDLFTRNINYADNFWAPYAETFDRGGVLWHLGSGASINNYNFIFDGNQTINGHPSAGSSQLYINSQVDRPTLLNLQVNSATLVNPPTVSYDRRLSGSPTLPDGTNGGEMTWGAGGRAMQVQGIVNSVYSGINNCYDFKVNGFDTDGVMYDQLIMGRDGTMVVRKGITANGLPVNAGIIKGSFSQVGAVTTTFTVTFGGTQPGTTYAVNVTPTAALSAALFYVTNKTTTTFDVVYLAGLTGTVTFDYSLFP